MSEPDEFRTHGDDSAVNDEAPLPAIDMQAELRRFRALVAQHRRVLEPVA